MFRMSKRSMGNFKNHHSPHTQKTQHAVSCTMCSILSKLPLTCTLIRRYWVHFLFCEHIHQLDKVASMKAIQLEPSPKSQDETADCFDLWSLGQSIKTSFHKYYVLVATMYELSILKYFLYLNWPGSYKNIFTTQ